jgi:hypothetical protein
MLNEDRALPSGPIQELVEAGESVVIPCVAAIREGAAAHVETRASTSRPPQGASL